MKTDHLKFPIKKKQGTEKSENNKDLLAQDKIEELSDWKPQLLNRVGCGKNTFKEVYLNAKVLEREIADLLSDNNINLEKSDEKIFDQMCAIIEEIKISEKGARYEIKS